MAPPVLQSASIRLPLSPLSLSAPRLLPSAGIRLPLSPLSLSAPEMAPPQVVVGP